jgi:predicted RNA-binding Zn ribbon-like protein
VARYDLPNAAPGPLRLVQLFVNTADREHGREWLGSVADLVAWLREHDLPPGRVGRSELEQARELREGLRALLLANNGEPLDRASVDVVNSQRILVRLDDRGEMTLRADGGTFGPVLGVAYAAMLDGTWPRLKACRNCGWAFYDASRNLSATWCSMAICGNRLKTRAYRRRQASR